ncbi:MAG: histidine phosphotransferase family protein [Pseudomonadota bacterium]
MGQQTPKLANLVGSRICHDLISPIGAINNGMELLAMSGIGSTPEMALISESVEAANARIRFFRIAYGTESTTQSLGRGEIMSILRDMTRGSRIEVHWEPAEDLLRSEVRVAFLAIQCAEQTVPFGGRIELRRIGQMWEITTTADRFMIEEDLWALLSTDAADQPPQADIKANQVQFLLLPEASRARGRTVSFAKTEKVLRITA